MRGGYNMHMEPHRGRKIFTAQLCKGVGLIWGEVDMHRSTNVSTGLMTKLVVTRSTSYLNYA